jgi:hypothetical protein
MRRVAGALEVELAWRWVLLAPRNPLAMPSNLRRTDGIPVPWTKARYTRLRRYARFPAGTSVVRFVSPRGPRHAERVFGVSDTHRASHPRSDCSAKRANLNFLRSSVWTESTRTFENCATLAAAGWTFTKPRAHRERRHSRAQ